MSSVRRTTACLIASVLLAAGAAGAAAVPADVQVVLEANLWILNGDVVRQPQVPRVQKLEPYVLTLSDQALVSPSTGPITRLMLPERFGGGQTVTLTRTDGGARLLLANPTNRFDPFTAKLQAVNDNEAGSASLAGGWGGDLVINVDTKVVLDEIDAGGEFFVAQIPLVGAFGSNATATFTGEIAILGIPIEGTAIGAPFQTGPLTITGRVITKRRGGDPAGSPTGYQTFTFRTEGSVRPDRLSTVTPFIVESFAGVGPNRIPIPFRGFLRASVTGVSFATPEPGAWIALGAGIAGLALLRARGRGGRRGRSRR